MKIHNLILILALIVSCNQEKAINSRNEGQPIDSVHIKSSTDFESNETLNSPFQIDKYITESDSILKTHKGDNYSFVHEADTFDYFTEHMYESKRNNGIFSSLCRHPSESIIFHRLYDPNTKKQLRLLLAEATYSTNAELEKVVSELIEHMHDSIPDGFDSDHLTTWRLSPIHDYVITSSNKLFWLNAAYPYSNSEFKTWINSLKENLNQNDFKGRIICLFGSDCEIL